MSKPKITQKQARANEQAVWRVYPEATYFGVDDKSKFPHPENCVCQVYDNSGLGGNGKFIDSKVIGEGDTYEEAWADALKRLIPVEQHPHRIAGGQRVLPQVPACA